MKDRKSPKITHISASLFFSEQPMTLKDDRAILVFLENIAKALNSKVLEKKVIRLQPQGIIAYAILLQSHISLHIWEEQDFAFLDVATSCPTVAPEVLIKKVLEDDFPTTKAVIRKH